MSTSSSHRRHHVRSGLALALALMATLAGLSCSEPFSGTDEGDGIEATVTIAFIGDQGWEAAGQFEGPRAVLLLIREEGTDAVLHQGDFDYLDDPAAWEQQIDDILGPEFPYFMSVGNHDVAEWDTDRGYKERMEARAQRIGVSWDGELGEMAALEFEGLYLVFVAPGTLDSDNSVYADYIADRLSANDAAWSICSWHKNQTLMQLGSKGDETGWAVYERCREGGAIIATAHEHSYSRTHLLSDMESQVIASTSDTLVISGGESFVFVSGLGGKSIRNQDRGGDWWAAVYASDQGANYGALFGEFGVDGRGDLAHFYFKDINGVIADEFWVVSGVGGPG